MTVVASRQIVAQDIMTVVASRQMVAQNLMTVVACRQIVAQDHKRVVASRQIVAQDLKSVVACRQRVAQVINRIVACTQIVAYRQMRTYLVSARMHLVSAGSQDTYIYIRMYQGYYAKTNVVVEVRRHELRGPLDFGLFSLEQHQFR